MAPTATTNEPMIRAPTFSKSIANGSSSPAFKEPLVSSGSLDQFRHFESTPPIGREYPELQLSDVMNSPNRNELIRDLAIVGMLNSCNRKGCDHGLIW